jgi:hypothetical protein
MHNAYAPSRAAPPAYQSAPPPPASAASGEGSEGGKGGGDGADAEIAAFMSSTGACATPTVQWKTHVLLALVALGCHHTPLAPLRAPFPEVFEQQTNAAERPG